MENRILVPLDNTEISENVIILADEWAQKLSKKISFLHVINPNFSWVDEKKPLFEDRFETAISNFNIKSDYEVIFRVGKPYQKILEVEQDIKPELCIMAAHSHTVLHRFFLGSNTDHVIHGIEIPMIVYKNTKPDLVNICVVPVDYTEVSKPLIQYADDWAQWQGAELVFVHVDEIPEYPGNAYMMESGFFRQQDLSMAEAIEQKERDTETERLQERLDRFIAEMNVKSKYQTMIRYGIPYVKIMEVQKSLNAKLIMLAAHSHTVIGRMFLGSNTDYLMHHSECPLYVYKSKEYMA